MISMTTSLVLSCMNVYMATFLIYFRNYFQRNADIHDHNLRNVNDLYVPYGRLDIRKFSVKIAGPNLWNSLPSSVKNSETVHIFKKNMRHYLTERKGYT